MRLVMYVQIELRLVHIMCWYLGPRLQSAIVTYGLRDVCGIELVVAVSRFLEDDTSEIHAVLKGSCVVVVR
jgi:hypothetical protein